MSEMHTLDLQKLDNAAKELLDELVTPEGIFASSALGWDGPYHAWFGRDSAITADFIFAALEYGGDRELAYIALDAIKQFANWQGQIDNPVTGEQAGKIPHEIRTAHTDTSSVQHAANTNEKPWFVDPADGILKNWDTADGTSLWVTSVIFGHNQLGLTVDNETKSHIKHALDWIINNVQQYDGLVGFTGAEMQPGREFSGLHNQGWKDSGDVYQVDGANAIHPIKDVLVNADAWAALRSGLALFAEDDPQFSAQLESVARNLQQQFNSREHGFVLPSGNGLAQAIDGNNHQMAESAIDQGAVLWATSPDNTPVVDETMAATIVRRMMADDMLNPEAGIRDYAKGTVFTFGTDYHGNPNTYWPFMSGLTARGMQKLGYIDEAKRVMYGYLNAVTILGTNIEMFIQDENDDFEPWSHPDPDIGQKSSREQAWTAAAVYYATKYLVYEQSATAPTPEA